MEKFIYYNDLFLAYKSLLKENAIEIFDLYYGENLTMQEIADLKHISKARVGIIIKDTEKKLNEYESKLRVVLKNIKLEHALKLDDIKDVKKDITDVLNVEEYVETIDDLRSYYRNKGE